MRYLLPIILLVVVVLSGCPQVPQRVTPIDSFVYNGPVQNWSCCFEDGYAHTGWNIHFETVTAYYNFTVSYVRVPAVVHKNTNYRISISEGVLTMELSQ